MRRGRRRLERGEVDARSTPLLLLRLRRSWIVVVVVGNLVVGRRRPDLEDDRVVTGRVGVGVEVVVAGNLVVGWRRLDLDPPRLDLEDDRAVAGLVGGPLLWLEERVVEACSSFLEHFDT